MQGYLRTGCPMENSLQLDERQPKQESTTGKKRTSFRIQSTTFVLDFCYLFKRVLC
jgi:hypothetical protein